MVASSHPSFQQPGDPAIKVWRYMDLARLVSLLSFRKLPLVRVDLLQDQFEGSISRALANRWAVAPTNATILSNARPELRAEVFVSCWRMGNDESEAMWRLYCGGDGGVALQTTYQSLAASLPDEHVHIGKVTYIDYETGMTMDDNMLTPFMHKRLAFQHEQEVRILLWHSTIIARLLTSNGLSSVDVDRIPTVYEIDWNAERTVEKVYVSPYAPEWYQQAVRSVVHAFAPLLADQIVWSRMKGSPLF